MIEFSNKFLFFRFFNASNCQRTFVDIAHIVKHITYSNVTPFITIDKGNIREY